MELRTTNYRAYAFQRPLPKAQKCISSFNYFSKEDFYEKKLKNDRIC